LRSIFQIFKRNARKILIDASIILKIFKKVLYFFRKFW